MARLVSLAVTLALAAPAAAADVVFNPGRHPTTQAATLLTPDGKSLVILGSDRCMRLWDVESGKPVAELWLPTAAGFPKGDSYFRSLLWVSPDSKLLAVPLHTNEEPRAKIAILPLSGDGRGTYRVVGGHAWGTVDNAVFSPDGKVVATSAGGHPVVVWEVATGKKVCEVKFDPDMRPAGMAFSPDGKKLTVALPMVTFNGGKHSGVSTFDATTGKFLGEIVWKEGLVEPIGLPRWSPDGKTLAVKRWEMELLAPDGTNARSLARPDPLTIPHAGEFDARGRFLVAWRKEGEYTVRDELAGKEVARFKAAGGQVQFSTDGSRMLTVDEGDATLHDLTGRGQTKTFRVAEFAPNALAWADGPKLG
ncbi:MAG TPA: WD40 repeat domain-containing protein, partial [Gemmata sp.]|nr:WD40 repeat domain-containing protein [Gemmata sp.]